MHPNSNEPTHAQPTDVLPPRMEPLPQKATQPSPQAKETAPNVESAEVRQEEARTVRYAIGKLNDFLQWFILVLEVALAIRVFFKLIGAQESNLFAGFLYSLTNIVLFPFLNIVPTSPGNRFAGETLIAMVIYWLIFWAIRRFMHILITGPEETAS
jgi:YGGT family